MRKKCLNQEAFKLTAIPGLCIYKFIYLWSDILVEGHPNARFMAWKYVIPNPLFPFIWYRTAIYGHHPEIEVKTKSGKKVFSGCFACKSSYFLASSRRAARFMFKKSEESNNILGVVVTPEWSW